MKIRENLVLKHYLSPRNSIRIDQTALLNSLRIRHAETESENIKTERSIIDCDNQPHF